MATRNPPGHVSQSNARTAGRSGGADVLGHRCAERAAGVAGVLGIVPVRHGNDAVRVRHMDNTAGGEHHAAGSVYTTVDCVSTSNHTNIDMHSV